MSLPICLKIRDKLRAREPSVVGVWARTDELLRSGSSNSRGDRTALPCNITKAVPSVEPA